MYPAISQLPHVSQLVSHKVSPRIFLSIRLKLVNIYLIDQNNSFLIPYDLIVSFQPPFEFELLIEELMRNTYIRLKGRSVHKSHVSDLAIKWILPGCISVLSELYGLLDLSTLIWRIQTIPHCHIGRSRMTKIKK